MDVKKHVWTEKWRPNRVDDVIGDFTDKIKKYLANPDIMPHFLFYSRTPGTGKTTLSKAIINELGCDALILNSSDERKIDVIREKVKQFALTQSTKGNLRRCILLDESDGLPTLTQQTLRATMEQYSSNAFFILTCNNIAKIIEPIRSRCVTIQFKYPEKEKIKEYLKKVCAGENLNFTEEGLDEVIKLHAPSIRNCILCLQDLYTDGKEVTPKNVIKVDELYEKLWTLLKEKNWVEMKKLILESEIDIRSANSYIWERALKSETPNTKIIQLTCRNERDIALGADPKVVVVTSVIEMCQCNV